MPTVSVIVPIYNVENYLKQCLDSLIQQEYQDMEVIMVNDGSTDKSVEIAKIYAEKYTNFILIEQNNRGLSAARNIGLKHASGEYIMYLDSDDYLEPRTLTTCLDKINRLDPDLLVFSGNKIICNENNDVLEVKKYGPYCESEQETGLDLYQELRKNNNYYTCVVYQIVKKDVLDRNNIEFFEGILHEDHLYTFLIFAASGKSICINQNLYNYRVRANSIMTSNSMNGKRFEGFATTYCQMQDWYCNAKKNNFDKITLKTIDKHLKYICLNAIKYYIKMSEKELMEYKSLSNMFFNGIKGQKFFGDVRYMLFYSIHEQVNKLYSVIINN